MNWNQLIATLGTFYLALLLFGIAGNIFLAWVVWMFYRCFRDTADELRKLRIAFEFDRDRQAQRD